MYCTNKGVHQWVFCLCTLLCVLENGGVSEYYTGIEYASLRAANEMSIITARNEVGARLCFYRCVLFCSRVGGVPDQVPPRDQVHPPGPGTPPWDQVHPPDQVTPLGPGTPPWTRYTPRDQVHPPGTRYTPPPDQGDTV